MQTLFERVLLGHSVPAVSLNENWGKLGSLISPQALKNFRYKSGYGDDARFVTRNPTIGRNSDVKEIKRPSPAALKTAYDDNSVAAIIHCIVLPDETIYLGGYSRIRSGKSYGDQMSWEAFWDREAIARVSGQASYSDSIWKLVNGKVSLKDIISSNCIFTNRPSLPSSAI